MDRAREAESAARDFACTLMLAVVGSNAAAMAQIGDGAIVIAREGEGWEPVFWPQHGPYINTTYFVTDDDALGHLCVKSYPTAVNEVALFTDGLENLSLNFAQQTAHSAFFDRIFAPIRAVENAGHNNTLSSSLADYLRSPLVADRTDDDITLVLATRLPGKPTSNSETVSTLNAGGRRKF